MPRHLLTSPVALLLLSLAGYWVLLIYQLGAQWSAYEQYSYGWAVPFLCGYLLWQRLRHPSSAPGPQLPTSGFGLQTSDSITRHAGFVTYLILALLALGWFVTRWLHEANPIWRLSSWVLAFIVIGLTLIVTRLLPAPPSVLRSLVFPICFFLVAVPWPSGFEALMTQSFMQANVSATTELLAFAGIPALQRGNVIEIATGLVGVDEACSGIRSFQATLMISLFLGELYRLSIPRRVVLCLAGVALAFLLNIGRTFLLVYVASRNGIAAIDKWHDPAGTSILVGCFVGLWLIGMWLARRPKPEASARLPDSRAKEPEIGNPQPSALDSRPSTSPALGRLAFVLAAWFLFTELAVEGWYRAHEVRAAAVQAWTLRWPTEDPTFKSIALSAPVKAQLAFDEGSQGAWTDPTGNFWQMFYFRWLPSRSLYSRVRSQLNKAHRPENCLTGSGMKQVGDLGVGHYRCGEVRFSLNRLLFESDGRPLRVFYAQYEDSANPEFLASYRANTRQRIASAWAGSRNYGLRILELAVAGNLDEAQADAAVQRQLERLIQVVPTSTPQP